MVVDPLVEAWYYRALYYKKQGKLGTKLLHEPQTHEGKVTWYEYDLGTYDENGPKAGNKSTNTNTYTPPGTLTLPTYGNTKTGLNTNNYFDTKNNLYSNFNKK